MSGWVDIEAACSDSDSEASEAWNLSDQDISFINDGEEETWQPLSPTPFTPLDPCAISPSALDELIQEGQAFIQWHNKVTVRNETRLNWDELINTKLEKRLPPIHLKRTRNHWNNDYTYKLYKPPPIKRKRKLRKLGSKS